MFWLGPPTQGSRPNLFRKLAALTVGLVIVFEVPAVADWLFWPLWPILQFKGSMYEWVFRARLDAYSSLFGMWFAFARPEMMAFLATVRQNRITLVAFTGALVALFLLHAALMYPMARNEYNGVHRFTTWLPIAAYALLRCCTASLSAHYSRFFAAAGSCSLDLYLLQFHLWLAHNAKDILAPLAGARHLSFMTNTAAYLAIAWTSAKVQNAILSFLSTRVRYTFVATLAIVAVLLGGSVAWG